MTTDGAGEFDIRAEVTKVDNRLGLVMGFGIVCTEGGEPYFDLQGDHVPDESMLKAALDFMKNAQVAKEMHTGERTGTIVFAWPLTADIAKAFGIETQKTGLMIAMHPDDPTQLDKFADGTFTGFSIGGVRITDEEVD